MKKLFFAIILLLPVYNFAQCPGAAVSYTIDLSSKPDSVWISPTVQRNGYACTATGTERCISVVVTINPATTVINFEIASGAIPSGSLYYQVDCGTPYVLGQPSCVSGLTTFCVSFCKPGTNSNTYKVSASRNYHQKQDTLLRQNCSKLLAVNELSAPSVNWNSVNPGVPGQYNSYLSCTSGCNSSTINPIAGAPAFVDYKIAGNDGICNLPVMDTVRVFIDPPMTVAVSPTNGFVCTGGSPPVTLTATPTGGMGPYSYLWSPGSETTSAIDTVPPGTYTVNVTDNTPGCVAETQTVTVASIPTPSSPTAGSNSPVCETVSLNLTASTVVGATYSWIGPNGFTSSLQNPAIAGISTVGAGTYTVVVEENGCVSAPATTNVLVNVLDDASFYYATSTFCQTGSNPVPTITGLGGGIFSSTAGLVFVSTSTGEIDLISSTLGTYTVTYTTSGSCPNTSVFVVTITTAPDATFSYNASYCNNDANPLPSFGGGASAGTFSSTTGLIFVSTITGEIDLAGNTPGVYNVINTIAAAGGCSAAADTFNVTINAVPTVFVSPSSTGICNGASVNLTASGATTYMWSTGATTAAILVSPNVSTTYTVTGTNPSGCTSSYISTVTVNALPTASLVVSNDTICSGGFSNMSLNYTGADSFSWSPGGNNSSSVTVSPAFTTSYTVTLINTVTGCSINLNQQITVAAPLSITPTTTNVSCNGFSDGSISTSISGAAAPVQYNWSNGAQSSGLANLPAGVYTLNITDAHMCTASTTVTLTQPAAISISLTPTNVNCGQTNGSITSSVSNGTAPYTYMWSNGDHMADADSLIPGLYKLEVLDINGCQGMATAVIAASNGPVVSLNSINHATCNGANDGAINTTITGGSSPLTILWNTGSSQANISGLSAGVYDLEVSDTSGCITNVSYVVIEPSPVLISETVTPATCGVNDGSITTSVSGGTSPYTYQWSVNTGSATTANVSALTSGFYTLTVTDAQNCVLNKMISVANITNSIGVVLNTIQSATCGNPVGMIDVSVGGNAPPFIYQWSSGQISEDMLNVIPGPYSLMVTDAGNCNAISSYTIPSGIAGYTPQICLVTVNDTSNKNRVVWEKQYGIGIKSYNIYRETSVQGSYLKVAVIPFDSMSVFQDTIANTNSHSWRYKLSATDSCNEETPLSSYQKTIHRIITPNTTTGNVQLTWDYYDGALVNQYYIYRELGFDWELIDSVPSTVFSYVDIAPSTTDLDYLIEADLGLICNPTMRLNGNNHQTMGIIVKSRSNIKTNRVINPNGIKSESKLASQIKVYPNPVVDLLTVEIPGLKQEATIEVVNMLGQLVYTEKTKQAKNSLNASSFQNGVYILKVKIGDSLSSTRLIIQK